MLNITSKYTKVWKVEVKEKMVRVTLSSSSKDKDGNWTNSNWNAIFIGKAFEGAKSLKEKDLISITSGVVENVWNKEKNVTYLNLKVFEFEYTDGVKKVVEEKVVVPELVEDDELPF